MTRSGNFDAVVVGAGHNGLVAAGYLARAGLRCAVLERTGAIGGLCQTTEVLPGLRGNMAVNSPHNLDPEIIDDLALEQFGLQWIPLEGSVAFLPEATKVFAYDDPELRRRELSQFHPADADGHEATMAEMVALGRKLDVSFYDPPPPFSEVAAKVDPGREEDFFGLMMFGSAAELATERLHSEQIRVSLAMLAVSGNFAGPHTPGSAYQLIQRPLYRGSEAARHRRKTPLTPDFAHRAPLGGMGAIAQAMAASARAQGVEIQVESGVSQIKCADGRTLGVLLDDGREIDAPLVLSAINPKSTLLDLVPSSETAADFRSSVEQIPMNGCIGKIYLALDGEPKYAAARDAEENALLSRVGFRCGPTLSGMDRSFALALQGDWSGEPVVYGIMATAVDPTLSPDGRHLMSLSVSYAPYRLANGGKWSEQADPWAKHVISWLSQHITNLPEIIDDYGVLSPAGLEQRVGLLEGNCLHGEVSVRRMFNWRPVSGFSDYTTPVEGLYLCSNGTWPANYLSGLPGRNAALKALGDTGRSPTGVASSPDTRARVDA